MKKSLFLLVMLAFILASCGNKTQADSEQAVAAPQVQTQAIVNDASVVNVYYFHGKQRCKTCIAVEDVTKKAIAAHYSQNPKVRFVEVNIDDESNNAVVEKYEIAFSSLLIAKGDDYADLTEQAFASAVGSPNELIKLIRDEVNKRID